MCSAFGVRVVVGDIAVTGVAVVDYVDVCGAYVGIRSVTYVMHMHCHVCVHMRLPLNIRSNRNCTISRSSCSSIRSSNISSSYRIIRRSITRSMS